MGQQHGVGHGAADDQDIDLGDEILEQVQLGRHLCAADDGEDRLARGPERIAEGLKLRLHGAAGTGREPVGDGLG